MTIDDIRKGLLQKIQQVGNAAGQDFNRSTVGRTLQAPQVQNFLRPIQQEAQNFFTKQIPAVNRLRMGVSGMTPQNTQNFYSPKSILDRNIKAIPDFINAGKFGANLFGAPKLLTSAGMTAAGINAGLGGGINKAMGGSFFEGAGQGAAMTPSILGITGITNPLIERGTNFLAPKIAPRLINNPIGNHLVSGTLRGLQNIPEGAVIDATLGRRPLSAGSAGLDFLSGFVGKGTNLKGAQIDANAKVPRMHPDDINDTSEALTNLLTNKSADYDISGARKKDEEFIRNIAETYISKTFARQKSFQVVAQEVKNRLRQDLGRDAVELPNLGMGLVGKSDVAQQPLSDIGKTYYIRNGLNELVKAENAKPINLGNNIEAFSHRFGKDTGVVISEAKTGMQIATGKTEKEAIANAQKAFKDLKDITPQQLIERQLKSLPQSDIRGDLTYLKKGLKDTLGDAPRTDPKSSRLQELEYYAKQGNEDAQAQLANVREIEADIAKATAARDNLKVKPQIQKEVGGYDIASEPRVQGQMRGLTEKGRQMTIDAERSRRPVISEPDMPYILKRAGASPEDIASGKITVYRATENGRILPGDFVTPDKSVLKPYFDQRVETGRNPKIITQKVDVKDLVIGDEVTDFVYRPQSPLKSNTQLGTRKLKIKPQPQIQKEVGEELSQLIKEAKKYKSAGEFESAIRDNKNGVGNLFNKYRKNYNDPNLMGMWDIYNQHVKSPLKSHTQLGSATNNRMDMNTPNLQRSSELSTQLPQTPETGLGGTKDSSSLRGSGSSGRIIAQVPNSENPYFNTNKLNVSGEAKQKVNEVIQEVKPQIEKVVGRRLSNKEVIATANNSAKVLKKAVDREQTADFTARLLKTRQQLAAQAESGTVTKEYIDNLIVVKSHASDIGRKLQAFNIGADPKLVTSKDAILDAVLKVEQDSDKVIKAAKGVDFNDLKQATDFYRKFIKPTWQEKMDLVRYNSMLSSPNTHINNAFSNLGNSAVVAPIEKTLTGTLDFLNPIRRIKGKPQTQFASEGGAYTKGYVTSLNKAAHAFADSMRGKTITGNLDVRQIPLSTSKRVQMLNLPTRLLEASDQFFTTLTKGGEEAALNLRKSKGVKVGNIETQALDKAKYRLFRSELHTENQGHLLNSIDDFTALIQKARSSDNVITSTIAKFTLPFVQTPMNILKQGVEYSPAGYATMIGAQNKTEQLSKAIMGTAAAIGAGMLIASGRTTWTEPTSSKKKAAFRAAGMQPYSIKIGDKWVSYAKLPPAVGFPLAFLSSIHDAQANKKITDTQASTILSAAAKFGNFFADQSYVKNIGDLVASAKGSPESMVRFVSNYPQQLVPYRALLGWMARITDPYQRQVNSDAGFLEKQVQQLFTSVPGLSMTVPARLGPDGNPIPNQNAALNAFSPIRITNENADKKQYYDLLQQKTKNTRDLDALKAEAAKGTDISGMIGQVGAEGPSTKNNMMSDFQAKFETEMLKEKVKMTGKSDKLPNGDIVFPTDTGTSVFEVNPPTKGTGIDAFTNKDWNITQARKAWNNQKLSIEDKNYIYEKLGVDPKDVRYDALAHHDVDVSTQYILSKSADHVALLKNIITGRQESISGTQFASNGVIDNLVEQGELSKEEAKQLKALKFDKNGQSIGKSTSKAKKGKKLPLRAGTKANFKIATKQSNAKTIKSGKPTKIKTPNVSFDTQFSKKGSIPQAKKYQVKFNV